MNLPTSRAVCAILLTMIAAGCHSRRMAPAAGSQKSPLKFVLGSYKAAVYCRHMDTATCAQITANLHGQGLNVVDGESLVHSGDLHSKENLQKLLSVDVRRVVEIYPSAQDLEVYLST